MALSDEETWICYGSIGFMDMLVNIKPLLLLAVVVVVAVAVAVAVAVVVVVVVVVSFTYISSLFQEIAP